MLVWLKNTTKTQHQYFCADIPRDQPDLAFLVHKLQKSDKRSPCLIIQSELWEVFTPPEHPAEEFALKLHGYIATLIPASKCSMDYETTDGVAMLLRYVTWYVTKSHESTAIDSMYPYEVQGRHTALRYLMSDQLAEPEMWSFLFSKKVAWSASRTKPFTVPTSQDASENKTVLKYWKRDNKFGSLSMLQWLRLLDTNKADPKLYEHGSTLVGTNLTFTNEAANELNNVITSTLFSNNKSLAHIQLDSMIASTPIFKGMRVMITQNRNKLQNVVKGQIATIERCHNTTEILRLPSNKLVPTYPVTLKCQDTSRTCYPFQIGYANTMCKAQGQTLTKF